MVRTDTSSSSASPRRFGYSPDSIRRRMCNSRANMDRVVIVLPSFGCIVLNLRSLRCCVPQSHHGMVSVALSRSPREVRFRAYTSFVVPAVPLQPPGRTMDRWAQSERRVVVSSVASSGKRHHGPTDRRSVGLENRSDASLPRFQTPARTAGVSSSIAFVSPVMLFHSSIFVWLFRGMICDASTVQITFPGCSRR